MTRFGTRGVPLYEGTKHSTATHLKALGADDRLLAQLVGRRDARSVEKYAKLGSSAIRPGLERLHKRGRGEDSEAGPGCSRVDVNAAFHHLVAALLYLLDDDQTCHRRGIGFWQPGGVASA
jgi:hypothetical protein